MLDLGANALLQGLTFGVAALGLVIAFRVVRYPDLSGDGSFTLGSVVFAAVLGVGVAWPIALLLAALTGAAAGLFTAGLNSVAKVNRLLSGILTSLIAYSLAFRILGGRPNVGLSDHSTLFTALGRFQLDDQGRLVVAALLALAILLVCAAFLRTEKGLVLRATGANSDLVAALGHRPAVQRAIGLALANGLVGTSGALVTAQQGFADINMGSGAVVTFIAALVIGEEFLRALRLGRPLSLDMRLLAAFVGAALYFFMFLLVLRASWFGLVAVAPTDLKLLTALLVALAIAIRRRPSDREDLIPL